MDVISPYRKPPCNAWSSVAQPVDAGAGAGFGFESAVERRAEPRSGGTGSVIARTDQLYHEDRDGRRNTITPTASGWLHMMIIMVFLGMIEALNVV